MSKCCRDNYSLGFIEGSDDQYYFDRIAVFGAIRRAAEVARKADNDARHWLYEGNALRATYYHGEAIGIRTAIRAAIGSPKA